MLGSAEAVEVLAQAERLYLNSIVLGELLGDRAKLVRFLDSPRVGVLPAVTSQTADSYALVYAGLRRRASRSRRTTCGSPLLPSNTAPLC